MDSDGAAGPASPGEGWWLASDGNWYPPTQAPAPAGPPPSAPGPPPAGQKNTAAIVVVVAVALVLGLGAFFVMSGAEDDSASSALDAVDTADGIEVTITSCEAEPLDDVDGISQTLYRAEGTVEDTSGEPRVGVTVDVIFLDGASEFYRSDVGEVFSFGGFEGESGSFDFSVTLSDEVDDLRCEAAATS